MFIVMHGKYVLFFLFEVRSQHLYKGVLHREDWYFWRFTFLKGVGKVLETLFVDVGAGAVWFASEMKALKDDCERFEVFPPGHIYSSTAG